MTAATTLADHWYRPRLTALTAALLPLSAIYAGLVALRRGAYRRGILARHRIERTVVVVGNITVGGGGKTPLTLALARALALRGETPGVVSRGYGGSDRGPRVVTASDDAREVGDEPLLYARAGLAVAIGRDRVAAARMLVAAHPGVTLVLSDDGLQHYAMARDFEIVADAGRGSGNGRLLPAGPLREPVARLREVDAIVHRGNARGASDDPRESFAAVRALPWRRVVDDVEVAGAPACWQGLRVHAVAGIADPRAFFDALRGAGLGVTTRAFDDHHRFAASDFPRDADVVLMTEKDAVKCRGFADARFHYLPIAVDIDPALVDRVLQSARGR